MKYLPLLRRNLLRSKRRTVLTVLAVTVTIFIFVGIVSLVAVWDTWEAESEGSLRVGILPRAGFDATLPLSHEEYLRSLPQTEATEKWQWFGGYYRDPKEFFGNFGADLETLRTVWPELKIPEEQYRAAVEDRTGAIVGERLAKRFGWKLGQRVVLQGTIYPVNPELTIRALYTDPWDQSADFYFHFEYFRELLDGEGLPGWIWVRCRTREEVPVLIRTVEDHFANSPYPVKAMTEKEFMRLFLSMIGDIRGLVRNLGFVLVAMLLLVTANTMAMAVRERRGEVAILKALGFSPAIIVGLITAESMAVSILGAALGCAAGYVAFDIFELGASSQFGKLMVLWSTVGKAFGLAALTGLVSGLVPGALAARLPVVIGLRRVD